MKLIKGNKYILTVKPHQATGGGSKWFDDFEGEITLYYIGLNEDGALFTCECCGKERNKFHMFSEDQAAPDGGGDMVIIGTECVKRYLREA